MKRLSQAEINRMEMRFAELNKLIDAGNADGVHFAERDELAGKLDYLDRLEKFFARGFRVVLGGLHESNADREAV